MSAQIWKLRINKADCELKEAVTEEICQSPAGLACVVSY